MDKRETLWIVQYRPHADSIVRSIQETETLARVRAGEFKQSYCQGVEIITLQETERERV